MDKHVKEPDDPRYKGGKQVNVRGDDGSYSMGITDSTGRLRELKHQDAQGNKYNHMTGEYEKGGSPNTGCYIATATLQGEIPVSVLDPLKCWRYEVLESSFVGNLLSNLYRRSAPRIASRVSGSPAVASVLRTIFVMPSLRLVGKPKTLGRDVGLFLLFVMGMFCATLLSLVQRD